MGDTYRWTNAAFKLDSATIVPSVTLSSGHVLTPYGSNMFLDLCGNHSNQTGAEYSFLPGIDNNLSTDSGIGFVRASGWINSSPIPDGATRSECDVWEIPGSATTAVYAIYDGDIDERTVLYRIDLPDRATAATLAPTSNTPLSGEALTRRVKPALGQIVATNSRGETGGGTGFIVGTNGIMVTNRHVVDDAPTVEVRMLGGRSDLRARSLAAASWPTWRQYSYRRIAPTPPCRWPTRMQCQASMKLPPGATQAAAFPARIPPSPGASSHPKASMAT